MNLDTKFIKNPRKKVFKELDDIPSIIPGHTHKFKEQNLLGIPSAKKETPRIIAGKLYYCVKCFQDAYYCPGCDGYLSDKPFERKIGTRYRSLARREITTYYCKKCKTKLGRNVKRAD